MSVPYTKIVSGVPPMTPFVGPETIERRLGAAFRLRIGANESCFGISPKAKAAMADEMDRVSWYCDPEHFDLRTELAAQLDVGRENLVVGEGIDGLLGLIVRAFVDPGQTVVTSAGAYPTFNYHVIGYGGRLEFVPYAPDSRNDVDALLDAVRRTGAKLLYLANPDNPTGTFLGRAKVEAVLDGLPESCLFVLDEAYAEFAPPEGLATLDAADTRLIRLRTFSKAHGMAGLRLGYGIAAEDIIAAFQKIRLHFGVGRLSQVAALASLGDPGFVAGVVREVAAGRRDYEALARAHNLAFLPSLTNFVAIDLESAENSLRMVGLLEERGVFVRRPGVALLDRFVRVSVGRPEERAGFAEAFEDALKALRGGPSG